MPPTPEMTAALLGNDDDVAHGNLQKGARSPLSLCGDHRAASSRRRRQWREVAQGGARAAQPQRIRAPLSGLWKDFGVTVTVAAPCFRGSVLLIPVVAWGSPTARGFCKGLAHTSCSASPRQHASAWKQEIARACGAAPSSPRPQGRGRPLPECPPARSLVSYTPLARAAARFKNRCNRAYSWTARVA